MTWSDFDVVDDRVPRRGPGRAPPAAGTLPPSQVAGADQGPLRAERISTGVAGVGSGRTVRGEARVQGNCPHEPGTDQERREPASKQMDDRTHGTGPWVSRRREDAGPFGWDRDVGPASYRSNCLTGQGPAAGRRLPVPRPGWTSARDATLARPLPTGNNGPDPPESRPIPPDRRGTS